MGSKRYIKNLYSIAGVRWTNGDDVNGEFGVMLNKRNITNDTDRRTIADEQVLINLDKLRVVIKAEANTVSNIGTGIGVYQSKVDEDLRFKTLVAGTGIVITSGSEEVIISSGLIGSNFISIPTSQTFQLPGSADKGDTVYDTTIDRLRVWNGSEWKILSFE